jgi:hypothetical protein
MKEKQNLHTHTVYCDGADTPEQVVLTAIEKGFGSIGFSGHSYMYYSNFVQMTPEKNEKYRTEIARLKEKYRDRIEIFCGLEYDMYSDIDQGGYDYLIEKTVKIVCDCDSRRRIGAKRVDRRCNNNVCDRIERLLKSRRNAYCKHLQKLVFIKAQFLEFYACYTLILDKGSQRKARRDDPRNHRRDRNAINTHSESADENKVEGYVEYSAECEKEHRTASITRRTKD